jgi:flagellar basal-body rod protein FlgB
MMPTTSLLSTLESYLKLTTSREQAISANMANVDTPGYRTLDGIVTAQLSPAVREVQGLMERPDGNNVNLDREGLLMAQTQLQYQIGVQLVKHQFHQILSAISGGGQS